MASPFAIRPRRGLRALGRLMRDPDDTAQVEVIVQAFEGAAPRRIARRARRTPEGALLLREKPDLPAALRDRAWLASLPEGTLGRAYLDFARRYNISGDGLMEVLSNAATGACYADYLSEDELFLNHWVRNSHDLYHVVTGYETDLLGEAAVLNFSLAQNRNPGLGVMMIPPNVLVPIFAPAQAPLLWQAAMRGLRAKWFLVQNWVALLEEPLEKVRRELQVSSPPRYTPVYSSKFRSSFENAAH